MVSLQTQKNWSEIIFQLKHRLNVNENGRVDCVQPSVQNVPSKRQNGTDNIEKAAGSFEPNPETISLVCANKWKSDTEDSANT